MQNRISIGIAAVLLALAVSSGYGETITLEAEEATLLGGVVIATNVAGYSGTGYATGFTSSNDRVHWEFCGTPGLFNLNIRYRASSGMKNYGGTMNGFKIAGCFPQTNVFSDYSGGLVEVVGGTNTLEIFGGWNWYQIDRVVLMSTSAPAPPLPVPSSLADTQAFFSAQMLMNRLVAGYGRETLSGQHGTNDLPIIRAIADRKPVIVEGDLMDYSPSRVLYQGAPAHYMSDMMALDHSGYILAFSWHWNAPTNLINSTEYPWWGGFYADYTTFDLETALNDTNSMEYGLLLRDIDAIAIQLNASALSGIPIIWRPLHEAEGGWFWWGAHGPELFKKLWRLVFARMTVHHSLHNLIWVYTGSDPNWYPGDDVVDIIGVDGYPSDRRDTMSANWDALKQRYDGRKLLALTEFGGVPDIDRMHRFGVWWAWFCSWSGSYGPTSSPSEVVCQTYQSTNVVTMDEYQTEPPVIVNSGMMGSWAAQFTGTGPRGASYRMLSSTNANLPRSAWHSVCTGEFSGGIFYCIDPFPFTDSPFRLYCLEFSVPSDD